MFTTAAHLLAGMDFWVSLLLRYSGLFFPFHVIILKSEFLQALIPSETFPYVCVSCLCDDDQDMFALFS